MVRFLAMTARAVGLTYSILATALVTGFRPGLGFLNKSKAG